MAKRLSDHDSQRANVILAGTVVADLNRIDLNNGPLATFLQHLAQENTAKSRAILVKADQIADTMGLGDELLDGLVPRMGL